MSKVIDSTAAEALIRRTESQKRFTHSVSVGLTNVRLNHKFGEHLDDEELYVCGLLHDICREWDAERLFSYVKEHSVPLEDEEWEATALLHGPVAADMLRGEGYPEELCTAVRWHTLGSVGMGRMGLIVFISDYLEPLRTHITDEQRGALLAHDSLEGVALALLELQDAYFASKNRKNARVTDELEAWLRAGKRL